MQTLAVHNTNESRSDEHLGGQTVIRVLIVDDDPAFRRICREYLDRHPREEFAVFEADSGDSAMALCDQQQFDCILVDYRLPDTCGTNLIAVLKHHDGVASPIIMLTGVGSEDIAMEAVHEGAADYLPKQKVTPESLYRSITNSVEQTRLRRWIVDRNRQLEEVNDQLHRKNDQIQRFYHTVSHELKTPLTAAREFVSLVADGVMGDVSNDQMSTLEHALECCDLLATQFNDLVECTRLENNKMQLDKTTVEVNSLVEASLRLLRSAISTKGLSLDENLGAELPRIEVDPARVTQVLTNIISNAVKFTPTGGRISVSSTLSPDSADFVRISVEDSGVGIARDHVDRVFDRLFQVRDEDGGSSQKGLGLGLTIAHDIVKLHGGEIEVDSLPGIGSVFHVSLPIAKPA